MPSSDSQVIRMSVWAELLKLAKPDEDDELLEDGVGDFEPGEKPDDEEEEDEGDGNGAMVRVEK